MAQCKVCPHDYARDHTFRAHPWGEARCKICVRYCPQWLPKREPTAGAG